MPKDVVKLVDCGHDDFRVPAKRGGKVCRVALVIHNLQLAALVVDTLDRVLQLAVNDDTVGDYYDVVEYVLVLGVVDGREDMGEPRDGVRLAAARRMLRWRRTRGLSPARKGARWHLGSCG